MGMVPLPARWLLRQSLLLATLSATLTCSKYFCPRTCSCSDDRVFCIGKDLQSIPRPIPPTTSDLYLFANNLSQVEASSFQGLGHLSSLDLSLNHIADLPPGIFNSLAHLNNLDLTGNQLTAISYVTFRGLQDLERLYLEQNRIVSIAEGSFDHLPNLLELKLKGNRLTNFPALRTPQLLLLDLSGNPLGRLAPGSLSDINVEILSLASAALEELQADVFDNASNLRRLDISNNLLRTVPVALQRMPGLVHLNLSHNFELGPLQKAALAALPRLRALDLSYTGQQATEQGTFDHLTDLRELGLAGNLFYCDCRLASLVHWLHTTTMRILKPNEMRCHFPPHVAGRMLRGITHSELGCLPKIENTRTTATSTERIPTSTLVSTASVSTITTLLTTSRTSATARITATILPQSTSATSTTSQRIEGGRKETGSVTPCKGLRCLNGGSCVVVQHVIGRCICVGPWYGKHCQKGNTTTLAPHLRDRPSWVRSLSSTSLEVRFPDLPDGLVVWGYQLTYRDVSGADPRPISLNLPPSYASYALRGLHPNSTYNLCLQPMQSGSVTTAKQRCAQANTPPATRMYSHSYSPAKFQEENASVTVVAVTVTSAVVICMVVVLAAICYYKHRRHTKSGPSLEKEAVQDFSGINYDKCSQVAPVLGPALPSSQHRPSDVGRSLRPCLDHPASCV
uniref:vasorin isoform X1 n=2 Tax=Myxine glutinosa TaxID=7769 RepID=UPI00358E5AD6